VHEPNHPRRFFILDTESTEPFPKNLVRGGNHVLLSYKKRKDADRTVEKLNKGGAARVSTPSVREMW